MDPSTAEIESTIREKRENLRSNIDELSDKVKKATDWKHYYREHTGTIVALAFSAGVLAAVLGTRRPSSRLPSTISALGEKGARAAGTLGSSLASNGSALKRQGNEVLDRWDSIKRALVGVAATQVTGALGRLIPGFKDHLHSSGSSAENFAGKARDAASRL